MMDHDFDSPFFSAELFNSHENYIRDSRDAGNSGLFQCFFENIGDAAFLVDYEDMKFELANCAAVKLYGYTLEEFYSMDPSGISAEPEETASALKNRVSYKAERLHRKKNGNEFWVEGSVTFFKSMGREKIIFIIRDITQRKIWEQEIKRYSETLETAIESASLGLWDWNILKGGVKFNYLFCEVMELRDNGIPVNISDIIELIHPGDRNRFSRNLDEHLKGNVPFFIHEFKLNNNSRRKWVHSFGRIVERDCSGAPVRMLGFNRDITDSKNAREELLRAKLKAEESDRLKTAFLANMSHEIRTPLNAVAGFSRLLKRGGIDRETSDRYCDIIKTNSDQLIHIVSDILDLSKIENGKIELESSEINVFQFLKELSVLLDNIVHQSGKSGIETGICYPACNIRFVADEIRLMQIINNLLANAVKFTSEGKITAGCEVEDEYISFFVEDTGIGIPEENMTAIFERFRQGDNSCTRSYGGTGLGLAISKKLALLMNGDISVSSELNRGSRFAVKIPLLKPFPGKSENTVVSSELKEYSPGKTVLVADDIWHIHDFIKAVLDLRGYNIISAYNGKEALRVACDNDNIDLVLMDIQMPVMNGITAMSMLKEIRPNLPVVALTAHAMAGDRARYLNEGFDEYLSKPVDINLLFTLLDNILEKRCGV
jgi:PAS domain S-box-containing protein